MMHLPLGFGSSTQLLLLLVGNKANPCLYCLRCPSTNSLLGIMGVHVEDMALGGQGKVFEQAVASLRHRFPYRKWRVNEGKFCGAWYSKTTAKSSPWVCLLLWTRFALQTFPRVVRMMIVCRMPKSRFFELSMEVWTGCLVNLGRTSVVKPVFVNSHFLSPRFLIFARSINQAVRRARLDRSLSLRFEPIHPDQLTLACHSDAAFANVGEHTQAGYIIAFTEKQIQDGVESKWCPATWRSYKLSRAVASTLAAEAQAFCTASGTVEWMLLLMAEILDGELDIRHCRDVLKKRQPVLMTDCKSLCDHLTSPSSPTSIEDRRTSIDVVIIRESCRCISAFIRWVPTNRMVADAFTKDQGEPNDLLRACIRQSRYQISPEETVLQHQALERERCLSNRKCQE